MYNSSDTASSIMHTSPRKIPTLLGIVLVVAIVGVVAVFFESTFRAPAGANPSFIPQDVRFTNITDSSFSVTWITQAPTTGVAEISSQQQKAQTVPDERDGNGILGKFSTHSITYRSAKPDTEYSVALRSNGAEFRDKNNRLYTVKTARSVPSTSNGLEPAFGSVITPDNQPADGAIIYLTLEGSQPLSALVKPSGSWLIPLNLIRTGDLDRYLNPTDRVTEDILVRSGGGDATAITDTLNDSPVPAIVIGKTYDFRKQQAKNTESSAIAQVSPSPSASPTKTSLPVAVKPTGTDVLGTQQLSKSYKINLVAPAEGASLASTLPLVQGTGIPGKVVTITLGITHPSSGTTKVGDDGLWRYTPKKSLGSGKQSVTITTVNEKNKPVAITHTFTILKSGTQVLGEATPSATLTPTFTPTPTDEPVASPTATPEIPVTATTLPTTIFIFFGIFLLVTGALVLL